MTWFDEELSDLESAGLRRKILNPGNFKGVNFSSNDYLGLSQHPQVKSAAKDAVDREGTGGTSSRLLAGTGPSHVRLENALAQFFDKESALVFSSGYHLNTGLYGAIAGPGDMVFADRLCHASILDGLRLAEARFATFEHNNLNQLEDFLKNRRPKYRRAFVVTEGCFSMDGDHALLSEIVSLAHNNDTQVVIDEAHSVGVTGPLGRGYSADRNVLSQIDIFVGTLSKSLGSQGGFVAGSRQLTDLLTSRCRSFLFTTSLAPAAAAAAEAALNLIPGLEDERRMLKKISQKLRAELTEMGFSTEKGDSPIVPVFTGGVASTQRLANHLFERGFFVPSIRPPTVPAGTCRVRLSLTVPAVTQGWDGLLKAFEAHEERPQRIVQNIVE